MKVVDERSVLSSDMVHSRLFSGLIHYFVTLNVHRANTRQRYSGTIHTNEACANPTYQSVSILVENNLDTKRGCGIEELSAKSTDA
jgi:hypothetical protein